MRVDRGRCPRCRAKLAPPDPAAAAAFSRKLRMAAGALAAMFLLTLTTLWLVREPDPADAPAGPVGDPLADRRVPPAPSETPAPEPAAVRLSERPFLDPAGAAYAAYVEGDFEAALARYQEAISRNPRDAEALSNLGQVLVRLNRAEEALPFFRRAVAEIPDRWAYHFNQARALGILKRWSEAIDSYRRAQQLYPDDYAIAFNLALALHRNADYAAALGQYQKAIALDPTDPSFRMAIGMTYERLQKPAEAVAAYQEALRLAPEAPDADTVRARITLLTTPASPPSGSTSPPGVAAPGVTPPGV